MIPRVFVAGASKEIERSESWIAALTSDGIEVTCDWTKPVRQFGSEGVALSEGKKAFFARANLRGIDECTVFWLLTPEQRSDGAFCDLGYAVCRRLREIDPAKEITPAIIASPPTKLIYAALRGVACFATDQEAYDWILSR